VQDNASLPVTLLARNVAIAATAVILFPMAVAAATVTAANPVPWLAIAGIAWFAIDKIIDLLPVRESTIVQLIRSLLNHVLGKPKA
jgi:4-hydroxybenzoate polyprenyltransferase